MSTDGNLFKMPLQLSRYLKAQQYQQYEYFCYSFQLL